MKSMAAFTGFLLVVVLGGCASIHGQGDSATDNVVSIELRLDGQTCKPYVNPEDITARKVRPVGAVNRTENFGDRVC
jgi:hypothetical protein